MGEPMIIVERDGAVGVLTLNRAQALNALSTALMQALSDAVESFAVDKTIRSLLIQGLPRAFAAGADVAEMAQIRNSTEAQELLSRHLARWDALARCCKPTIAAVSGFALGGGLELALACDVVIAAQSAVFGMPEVLIGVMPGAGGVQRLIAAVGRARAIDMLLTGRRLNAADALAAGLVARVVPNEELHTQSRVLARQIAQAPVDAVRALKAAAQFEAGGMNERIARERALFYELFSTADQKEGMRAFLEKRAPKFSAP